MAGEVPMKLSSQEPTMKKREVNRKKALSIDSPAKEQQIFFAKIEKVSELPLQKRLVALPELYSEGRFLINKKFGNWFKAARALQISPYKINISSTTFQVKSELLSAYQEVKQNNLSHHWLRRNIPTLWKALQKHYKTIDEADKAVKEFVRQDITSPFIDQLVEHKTPAQLHAKAPAEYHSREEAVEQIKVMHAIGLPLNISAVKRRTPALLQFIYCHKPYWGWRRALTEAEVAYDEINMELEEQVECLECGESFSQLAMHLKKKHDLSTEEYKEIHGAKAPLISEMQCHLRQLAAADHRSCSYPHWEPFYTLEYLLDRLYYYFEHKMPLHRRAVSRYDAGLVGAIFDMGISWDEALSRIGLDPAYVRKLTHTHWSPEFISNCLQYRQRTGLPLNPKDLRNENENLYLAIRRHYDNDFDSALRDAGIIPNQVRMSKRYGKQEKKALIRAMLKLSKLPPDKRYRTIKSVKNEHFGCMFHFYKSWKKFCRVHGIPFWKISGLTTAYKTEEDVREAIEEIPATKRTESWINNNLPPLGQAMRRLLPSA